MDTLIKDIAKSINENVLTEEEDERLRFEKAWREAGLDNYVGELTVEEADEFFRKARALKW